MREPLAKMRPDTEAPVYTGRERFNRPRRLNTNGGLYDNGSRRPGPRYSPPGGVPRLVARDCAGAGRPRDLSAFERRRVADRRARRGESRAPDRRPFALSPVCQHESRGPVGGLPRRRVRDARPDRAEADGPRPRPGAGAAVGGQRAGSHRRHAGWRLRPLLQTIAGVFGTRPHARAAPGRLRRGGPGTSASRGDGAPCRRRA